MDSRRLMAAGAERGNQNMTGMFHEHDFRDYDFVIMDASYFLIRERNASWMKELKESRVYVPTTFEAERKAYRELLSEESRASYDALTRALSGCRKTPDRPQSAWEMVLSVSGRGKSVAVVTGNRVFIERIILENKPPLKADIFDLNRMEWISSEDFPALREELEFQKEELSETPPLKEPIGYGTTLYSSKGEELRLCKLGDKQMSGAESQLYGVEDLSGNRRGIAKIFRTGTLTPGKILHLNQITEAARHISAPWALFPTDTLYRDETRRIFAGILENYAGDSRMLFESRLYQGDFSSPEESSMRLSDNLRLCLNLVRQVCFLNHYGFFVSDFNLKNFALREKEPGRVLMFDTDSFGFQNYFSGFRAAGITTANVYDTKTKRGALKFCDDALYIFAFSILSLGSPAIYEDKQSHKRVFRFDEEIPDYNRKYLFPERLWRLFEDSFHNGKFFSAEMLLRELSETLRDLDEHPENDFEYGVRLDEIFSPPSPGTGNPLWKRLTQAIRSGRLDRVLLILTGCSIIAALYFLFQSGFFSAFP